MAKFSFRTDVVPASASSGASDPAALKQAHLPFLLTVVHQAIWSEITDLGLIKVCFEVFKLHPSTHHIDIIMTKSFGLT